MALNIKQLLNESMPHDLTFSEREKQQVRETVFAKKPTTFIRILPLAAVLLVSLVGYLLYSSYSDSQPAEVTWHEEIIIPNTFETSLNRSVFVPANKEVIYSKEDGLYSFSPEIDQVDKLVSTQTPMAQYSFAVNENWLVWEDFVNEAYTLNVLNRQTGVTNVIVSFNPLGRLLLEGNQIFYFNSSEEKMLYETMNLNSGNIKTIHEQKDAQADSLREAIGDGKAVVVEKLEKLTTFYIYDTLSGDLVQKSQGTYPSIHNMYINNERVYMDFATDEGRLELAYLDIQTGTISTIETPEYSFSTVHGNHVALSVTEEWGAETDDVELFTLEGNTVKPLTTFPDVKDRLVTPQFFEDGILRMVEENYSDGGPTLHLVKP